MKHCPPMTRPTFAPQPTEPTPMSGRLVVVSNREPYAIKVDEPGSDTPHLRLEKTAGGLVSALDPVLRENGGLWICWKGTMKQIEEVLNSTSIEEWMAEFASDLPYRMKTVDLTEDEVNYYYHGYANERLWPLFHYFLNNCDFSDERAWTHYLSANEKFARATVEYTTDDDFIWVQDYQLFLTPDFIRQKAPLRKIGFFNHIPFPAFEIFRILPKRDLILRGMLGADCIGFHIPEYVEHFLSSVEQLIPEAQVNWDDWTVILDGRRIQVRDFPISVDAQKIQDTIHNEKVQHQAIALKEQFPIELVGVGVDRLDYSKGILERLKGIHRFFQKCPEYQGRLSFVQIAAPTRTAVESYQTLREEVELTVGRINGELAREGWVPIHYFYRSFSHEELLPYFMISDFALLTPLRDGMNLVAKEYCVVKSQDYSGALILSELTGASYELKDAYMVNPFSVDDIADRLYQVITASTKEKRERMTRLSHWVVDHDIHHWVQGFLGAFNHACSHPHRNSNTATAPRDLISAGLPDSSPS